MENKTLRKINIRIYGPICMAGYTVTKNNPLTMHHIIPLCKGGKSTIENSSNISILAHSGIHIVSHDDYIKEKRIIEYLLYFKEHPDEKISKEFAQWLKNEIINLEYEETMTKNGLLMYKRRKKK